MLCSLKKGGWAPISAFGLNVLVYLVGLYQSHPNTDIAVHFIGGVAITYFYYKSLACAIKKEITAPLSGAIIRLILFTLVCTTAVFWEFLEWLAETFFHLYLQNSIGDTLLDMFIGILGGVFFIFTKWKKVKTIN